MRRSRPGAVADPRRWPRAFRAAIGLATLLCGAASWPSSARAEAPDELSRVVRDSGLVGHLRLYDYARWNDEGSGVDDNALAVGGDLRLQTGALAGVSLGLGFYSASNVPIDGETVNQVLVGSGHGIHTLSEAYVQYAGHGVLARGGRQLIDTPWARRDMFTMIPRAFTGVSVAVTPLVWLGGETPKDEEHERKAARQPLDVTTAESLIRPPAADSAHLTLVAARMWRYQSRFASGFTDGNRYEAHGAGFATAGIVFSQRLGSDSLTAQAWAYDFLDLARLGYAEAHYRWGVRPHCEPVVAAQLVVEGGSGDHRLGPVSALVYGAMAGLELARGSVHLVGNYSPVRLDSFRHGGVVHPYNDLSGTLYTDTMNDGIADLGPGYAYGVKARYEVLDRTLSLHGDYVRYLARYGFGGAAYAIDGAHGFPQGPATPNQRQWAAGLGLDWRLSGALDGLRVYERIGVLDWQGSARPFVDSRFGVVYGFGF